MEKKIISLVLIFLKNGGGFLGRWLRIVLLGGRERVRKYGCYYGSGFERG